MATGIRLGQSIRIVIVFGIVAALATAAWSRNSILQDDLSRWQDTVLKSPNKARPNYELGKAYGRRLQTKEAIYYMSKAAELPGGRTLIKSLIINSKGPQ